MVTPILIPVNEPGPQATMISSTDDGDKLFSFKMSSIYFVTYIECSPGILLFIWESSLPSFTKAIDTSDSDVSMNILIILFPHIC